LVLLSDRVVEFDPQLLTPELLLQHLDEGWK
jgi:hypothetical protein